MTFASPAYLWAFAGLAIPLAIHLLSRKEGKVIRVGSIRHVDESNTSQFKSIRLNEILLLLLRCLMIAAVVLFISGAQCSGTSGKNTKWVVAEPGINVDTLVANGYEFHTMPAENYWAYVEELNKLPYDIIAVSSGKLEKFTGERVPLNSNIRWITAEPTSTQYQALAWSAGDSVFIRTARSNSTITTYQTSLGVPDSIKVIAPSPIDITSDNDMIRAAINVLIKEYHLPIKISNTQQSTLHIKVTPSIGPLVERISPMEIHINKNIDQDIALKDNLVIELFKVLYPELQQPEINKDARVMPDELAWSQIVASSSPRLVTSLGIEKYLVILFLLLLAAERFVAIRRNQ